MVEPSKIKLIECPRDAMQGWKAIIPTEKKVQYLNALLKVGFDTLDFGSFVSAKAIPQMADTKEVIQQLDMGNSLTKLLAIVANARGASEALVFDSISYLGFPFSISPSFQMRNTNSSMQESFSRVADIQNLCVRHQKELVIYISMGFGNPYGDPYDVSMVLYWIEKMVQLGIQTIAIADTVGLASPEQVSAVLNAVIPNYAQTEIGVHLHSTAANWKPKLKAALDAGCRRFDGAIKGIGGCPMAGDELVGNMNTERMIQYFTSLQRLGPIDAEAFEKSMDIATEIFV